MLGPREGAVQGFATRVATKFFENTAKTLKTPVEIRRPSSKPAL
jgi:hypothetical protein